MVSTHLHNHLHACQLLPYDDWVELQPGSRVRIFRPGQAASYGVVDEVAEDASYFWTWLAEGRGQVLISEADGSTVWIPRYAGTRSATCMEMC